MILPIYTYGQGVLRKTSEDITPDYSGLAQLVADMFETLAKSEGVGLAAPQIGKAIRVVVVDLDPLKDDEPQYAGFRRAYINPHILEYGDKTDSYDEGCLSLPGINEKVKRPTTIRLAWDDTDGTHHEEWVDGFLARVLQHETDHLEGKVFTDRLTPLRKQLVKKKLNTLARGHVSAAYRVKPPRG
ncbi:MAG: peptide deformylase [Bacteroidaceae bacterium]|nr:peptide deformylase [Bacteroidaceae bacterium]